MNRKLSIFSVLSIPVLFGCGGNGEIKINATQQYGEHCDNQNTCISGLYCENGTCRTLCSNDNDCNHMQTCQEGRCVNNPNNQCNKGWAGDSCYKCADGYFGEDCSACPSNCGNHGSCNDGLDGDGTCKCDQGWKGEACDQCSNSRLTGSNCDECISGFTGVNCDICSDSHFTGVNCDECSNTLFTGVGCDECKNSLFTGDNCDICKDSRFSGDNCDECVDGVTDAMSDDAGNSYKTVCINKQFWMAENMKYAIPEGNYYYPNNSVDNVATYGLLYDWPTANAVCPSGWRLPTYDELMALYSHYGDDPVEQSKALRDNSFKDGLNSSGFAALAAGNYGIMEISGTRISGYYQFGVGAFIWSSTKREESDFLYSLQIFSDSVSLEFKDKESGYSVRCIKE